MAASKCMVILLLTMGIFSPPTMPFPQNDFLDSIIGNFEQRGWNIETKDMPGGRILVSVSDMKGWKGFQSTSFVFEFIGDFDAIEWVNANKQQTYEHAESSRDMLGVRPGSKAAYAHGLEKHYLFFRCGNYILKFHGPVANDYTPLVEQIERYCAVEK